MKYQALIATSTGIISYLIGGFDVAIITLSAFMFLDFITGMSASFITKKWDSEVGAVGLMKKGMIIIMVIFGVFLDRLITGDTFVFRDIITMFYIANEGLSIVENCGRIGLPIPERIRKALAQLSDENDNALD